MICVYEVTYIYKLQLHSFVKMNVLYQLREVQVQAPFSNELISRFNGYMWIPRGHTWFLDTVECYHETGDSFNSLVDVEITHCRHDMHDGEDYLVIGFDTLHLYDDERIANLHSGDAYAYARALLSKMLGFALVAANGAAVVAREV